jgi:predicted GNAT family acetyltransferase
MADLGPIVDNTNEQRFELVVDGHTAFSTYRLAGNRIYFLHTEVPNELRGRGVGSVLARGVLDIARERGLKVIPLCPFIAAYIRSHHEYLDLVSESNRKRFNLPDPA